MPESPATTTARPRPTAPADLQDRVASLSGQDGWRTRALPAIGLRSLSLSDGPAGVRGGAFGIESEGVLLPNPTSVAAGWDEHAAERAGRVLGTEARRAGVDWLLAPVLNLQRTPIGGRHFECLSEDPQLTARIGVGLVRGIQSAGVAATAKHFVGNESETERLSYDARIDEKTLREVYLVPFEAAVRRGDVDAVMAAYNSLNGVTATENDELLQRILRTEWGFRGAVVSDWGAARSTAPTASAGLDLSMPGPDGPWGPALVDAVLRGDVSEETIDEKLAALARVAARRDRTTAQSDADDANDLDETLAALAASGMVLLENDGTLPLGAPARIALIGPLAERLTLQGGGSAKVRPKPRPGLLAQLQTAFGPDTTIAVEPGVSIHRNLPPLADERIPEGITVRFEDASGATLLVEQRRHADLVLDEAVPAGTARIVVSATVRLVEEGTHGLAVRGNGAYTVRVDDGIAQAFTLAVPDRDPLSPLVEPYEHRIEVRGGREVLLTVVHEWDPQAEWHLADLGHLPPTPDDDVLIARAVEAARRAEVAILVIGTTAEHETEGIDRESLALPGRQDELVRAVCAANPRTVVVVNAGSPALLPWAELPAAVLWAWFPGQEGARALADCLLGRREPGGRLPVAIPATESGLPSVIPVDGVLAYEERDRFGSRAPVAPLYPLGYGLGYTRWEYDAAEILTRGDELAVTVAVRNTGTRPGRDIVQVYLDDDGAPPRLLGFAPVTAEAGASAVVDVRIWPEALRRWTDTGWRVLEGPLRLTVNRSFADPVLSLDAVLPRT
ncbi:glycoside hydrolase family 3 C-terminal domain-containing protein [Microbacterium sp. NPDC089698]|uniref:glycoside hydrolase family 3 C-terminal domain-containing protein n=1 Tax=Microbacterium sp. NPDC089698 TaxID=3364200 RepID=UPI003802A9BB